MAARRRTLASLDAHFFEHGIDGEFSRPALMDPGAAGVAVFVAFAGSVFVGDRIGILGGLAQADLVGVAKTSAKAGRMGSATGKDFYGATSSRRFWRNCRVGSTGGIAIG